MDKNRDESLVMDGILHGKKEKKKEVIIKESKSGRLVSLKVNNQTLFHLLKIRRDEKERENKIENSIEIKLEDFFKSEGVSAVVDENNLLIDLRKFKEVDSLVQEKDCGRKKQQLANFKKNVNRSHFQVKKIIDINFAEKLKFLQTFPIEEFILNGHDKKKTQTLVSVFDLFLPYIQDGRFLDIGCCTGITTKYACLFAGKKIAPFGVDINSRAIDFARNNFKEYANNFQVASFEDLDQAFLKQFSTVMLSVRFGVKGEKGIIILNRILDFLFKNKDNFGKESHIIILFENLFVIKERVDFFLEEIEKDFKILFLLSSIIVVKRKEGNERVD